ncbi:phage tail assembly protein [Roseomonas xinghualingensis]|uniref:phage tail assembly protein n=1 Tax=Roseomonas xinghualingensis TaxID=2986475 RepID=UPI0021F2155A|nr:phage tail assembly protein [Roseomonas sp. SXEYE001]MCV4206921.1 phage tail assembly protein [Roseomonas sp. SXEYE001]
MENEFIEDEDVIEDVPPKRIRFPKITFSGKDYDQVVLRPPSVGALMEAQKLGDVAGVVHLIHRVSGMPNPICQLLRPEVITKAGEYFARFLPPDPKAAGGGSPPA